VADDANAQVREHGFLRWIEVLADQGRLRVASSLPLEPDEMPQAGRELETFLRSPWTPPPADSWWLKSTDRRNALAAVSLSMGRQTLVDGNPARTERCWRTGVDFAPDAADLRFSTHDEDPAFRYLDLETELTALYSRYPALDSSGVKSSELIHRLFNSKAEAYDAEDLAAIQRHHTVLGILYARRGVWKSASGPENAIFQLEHALAVADRREAAAGYQPLPDLRALLADGYDQTGRTDRARTARVEAAQAYLDTDDFDRGRTQLDRVGTASDPGEQRRLDELRAILRVREEIVHLAGGDSVDAGPRLPALETAGGAWLKGKGTSGLPPDFLARQRFKTYADLTRAAAGKREPTARYALNALESLSSGSGTLIGGADVLRLERLDREVRTLVRFAEPGSRIDLRPARTTGDRELRIAPGTLGLLDVRAAIGPDLILGARVGAVVAKDDSLRARATRVTIAGTAVEVAAPKVPDEGQKRLRDQLDRVKGVDRVTIRRPGR
jgi:hypothetical protein